MTITRISLARAGDVYEGYSALHAAALPVGSIVADESGLAWQFYGSGSWVAAARKRPPGGINGVRDDKFIVLHVPEAPRSPAAPYIDHVFIDHDPEHPGKHRVCARWKGVDIEYTPWISATEYNAKRLARAVLAGVVYTEPCCRIDESGASYVHAKITVHEDTMSVDLRRLGF